jgi:hypothetical protein
MQFRVCILNLFNERLVFSLAITVDFVSLLKAVQIHFGQRGFTYNGCLHITVFGINKHVHILT